jgi:hypothetical protein
MSVEVPRVHIGDRSHDGGTRKTAAASPAPAADRLAPRLRRGWRGRSASPDLQNRSCLIDRQGFRLILGLLRDYRRVNIERCGNHCGRRVRQPVGQGDVLEDGTFEYFEELQLGVADVLDIMTIVALVLRLTYPMSPELKFVVWNLM